MHDPVKGTRCSTVTPEELVQHSAVFKQGVVKVTDGVYVAIGYGLANSVLLVGKDGTVIVDTLESVEAAMPVKKAFDEVTDKPLKAIIYTHYHPDHIGGAGVFAQGRDVDIYTQEETVQELNNLALKAPIISTRSLRMYGLICHQI